MYPKLRSAAENGCTYILDNLLLCSSLLGFQR